MSRPVALLACLLLVACGARQALSPDDHLAFELSLASGAGQGAVAWHGGPACDVLWFRRLDAEGRARGSPVSLTEGPQSAFEPDLQPAAQGYWLAWYEKDAGGGLTAWAAALDAGGGMRWRRALSGAGGTARNALIRPHGEEALVAWLEAAAGAVPVIWTARLRADGEWASPPRQRADAGTQTWNLNAAIDDTGTLHVVYDVATAGQAAELRWLAVRGEESRVQPLGSDDGHASQYPDIALWGDHVALAWFDARDGATQVYLATGLLSQMGPGFTAQARRVSRSRGPSFGAYVAWNAGRAAVAWCDQSGGQGELFVQTFGPDGSPLAPARQLTHTAEESSIPALRPWGSGFAVAWNEYRLPPAGVAAGRPAVASSAAMLQRLP